MIYVGMLLINKATTNLYTYDMGRKQICPIKITIVIANICLATICFAFPGLFITYLIIFQHCLGRQWYSNQRPYTCAAKALPLYRCPPLCMYLSNGIRTNVPTIEKQMPYHYTIAYPYACRYKQVRCKKILRYSIDP